MGGFPREFEFLIENLDPKRFQPWVLFYPSGDRLDGIGQVTTDMLEELRVEYGFERLFVVAHSMGGLVARSFILDYQKDTGRDTLQAFVSIATPWRGMDSARLGSLMFKPLRKFRLPYSWGDIATGSAFLNAIFYEDPETRDVPRRLPEHVSFHIICGCLADSDAIVPYASATRVDAVRDAGFTIHAFPLGHVEILSNPQVSERLNQILEDAARRGR
jgi:pimeloyl-ACP methyl ester carboxylesterase